MAKLVSARKAGWQGFTESQVHQNLDARLPDRMSSERRAAVADKAVSKMRERGMLREQNEAPAPGPTEETVLETHDIDTFENAY